MRHCVPCNADYLEAPERCTDCGGPTVGPEELESWNAARAELTDQNFEVVAILMGPIETSLFQEVFTDHEIPWIVRTHGDDGLSMIFRPQKGWGVFMVQHTDVERSRALVREIRASTPEAPEEG